MNILPSRAVRVDVPPDPAPAARRPFVSPRVLWMAALGLCGGLPLSLSSTTLTAWLAVEKTDLSTIGAFALVGLPYSLKPLWAPLLDRYPPPIFQSTRRRGWAVLFLILVALTIFAISLVDPAAAPKLFTLLIVALATAAASQDIVIDAWRTDVLDPHERGPGASSYIIGYRLGMLVTGAILLMFAGRFSFQTLYAGAGLLCLLCIVAHLLTPERAIMAAPSSLREAVVEPLREFFARNGAYAALGFVFLYKLGDTLLTHLLNPYLVGLGYRVSEIGAISKLFGLSATIVGAALGGGLCERLGMRRALLLFGAMHSLTHLFYLFLPYFGATRTGLIVAVGVDQFCSGLGIASFTSFMMSLCDRRSSATQYALLASTSGVGGRLFGAFSGSFTAHYGWTAFFVATMTIGLSALTLVPFLHEPRREP